MNKKKLTWYEKYLFDEIGIEFMEWEIDGKSVSCVKKEG